jgi:hypothetical protein
MLREVSEADLPGVALAEVGYEKQVVGRPDDPLRAIGRGAFLECNTAQDAS